MKTVPIRLVMCLYFTALKPAVPPFVRPYVSGESKVCLFHVSWFLNYNNNPSTCNTVWHSEDAY